VSFANIPRPVQQVARQANGPLAIVQDARNLYWIIMPEPGWIYRPPLETFDAAMEEALPGNALPDISSPPHWSPLVQGLLAEEIFECWALDEIDP